VCNLEDHTIRQCPKLHYTPNKKFIIRRALKEKAAWCSAFGRKSHKRFNALTQRNRVVHAVLRAREQILGVINPEEDFEPLSPERNPDSEQFELPLFLQEDEFEVKEPIRFPISRSPSPLTKLSSNSVRLRLKDSNKEIVLNKDKMKTILNALQQTISEVEEEEEKLFDFDRVGIYKKYFVHNNVTNVIARINRLNQIKSSLKEHEENKQVSLVEEHENEEMC